MFIAYGNQSDAKQHVTVDQSDGKQQIAIDQSSAELLISALVDLVLCDPSLSFTEAELVGVVNALILGHHRTLNPIAETFTRENLLPYSYHAGSVLSLSQSV